jgi:hypothetical protein
VQLGQPFVVCDGDQSSAVVLAAPVRFLDKFIAHGTCGLVEHSESRAVEVETSKGETLLLPDTQDILPA